MESIFDYDINESELSSLLIKGDRDQYLMSVSKFKRYSDMYQLFKLRHNEKKAEEVFQKFLQE